MGAPDIWGLGCMTPMPGPPTPRTGPARPTGACPIIAAGMPLPADLPTPGPPVAPTADVLSLASVVGGGPSTVMDTTSSPRRMTRPSTLLSSLSSEPFFAGSFLKTSASPRTTFMCLSNAMNLPTSCRPSWIVILIRKLM